MLVPRDKHSTLFWSLDVSEESKITSTSDRCPHEGAEEEAEAARPFDLQGEAEEDGHGVFQRAAQPRGGKWPRKRACVC